MLFTEYNFFKLNFIEPASPLMYGIIELHDHIFFFLNMILFLVLFLLATTLSFFSYKTNSKKNRFLLGETANYLNFTWLRTIHGTTIEIIWTIIPSIILILIAIPSFALLYATDELVDPSVTIQVIGHQWYRSYEYSLSSISADSIIRSAETTNFFSNSFSGVRLPSFLSTENAINEKTCVDTFQFDSYMRQESDLIVGEHRLYETDFPLVLPKSVHIRFMITADDVIHSWSVPALGIKVDAVPGRINHAHTFIKRSGIFYGQCSELCGVNHAFMPIQIIAFEPTLYYDYLKFLFLNK